MKPVQNFKQSRLVAASLSFKVVFISSVCWHMNSHSTLRDYGFFLAERSAGASCRKMLLCKMWSLLCTLVQFVPDSQHPHTHTHTHTLCMNWYLQGFKTHRNILFVSAGVKLLSDRPATSLRPSGCRYFETPSFQTLKFNFVIKLNIS